VIPGAVVIYPERVRAARLATFLRVTYDGDESYKSAVDISGRPMLIPHEGEGSLSRAASIAGATTGINAAAELPTRYARRLALASIENHYRPITNRILAYVTSGRPARRVRPEEYERVGMDDTIARMVAEALRSGEAWVGVDAKRITPSYGDTPTVRDAQLQDPKHLGRPYLISAQPDQVVAADFDPESGRTLRVVVRYDYLIDGNITSTPTLVSEYREWTDMWWAVYREERITTTDERTDKTRNTVQLRVVDSGTHSFGRCPWVRFIPPFPLYTIADLQRSLFNVLSLHDEELYQATFSQRYIIGVRHEAGQPGVNPGPGNIMFVPNPDAKVGVFGAEPEQARSIAQRADQLRQAIYMIASMDAIGFKSAAETEGKKRLDMESLQKLLGHFVTEMESIDNELAVMLGIIDDPTDLRQMTQYSRDLDVLSVGDALDLCERMAGVPYAPPSLKRSLVRQLAAKVEPFAPDRQYAEESERQFDFSQRTVGAIMELHREGALTPAMMERAMGLPSDLFPELSARLFAHVRAEDGMLNSPSVPNDVSNDSGPSDAGPGRSPGTNTASGVEG
jgi:hypothetical protein